MAEEEENQAEGGGGANGPEAEAQQSKKKKMMLMMIIAAVVLLGGGGGAFFFLKGEEPVSVEDQAAQVEGEEEEESDESEEEEAESGEGSEETAEGEEGSEGDTSEGEGGSELASDADMSQAKAKYGETYELKPFNLNLGNPLENRYIRLVIALEFKGGAKTKAEILAKTPKIRDIVVTIATKKTMEFLLGPDGKDHLRHELFVTINQSLENKIEAVYITDMLIE